MNNKEKRRFSNSIDKQLSTISSTCGPFLYSLNYIMQSLKRKRHLKNASTVRKYTTHLRNQTRVMRTVTSIQRSIVQCNGNKIKNKKKSWKDIKKNIKVHLNACYSVSLTFFFRISESVSELPLWWIYPKVKVTSRPSGQGRVG